MRLVSIRGIILQSNPIVKHLGYKNVKNVKKGEKMKKISMLSIAAAIFVSNLAFATPPTLVDYLNGRNVSFLIVNTGMTARLTTFGWKNAAEGCKTIKTAGFNVSNVRNYENDTLVETSAVCKY